MKAFSRIAVLCVLFFVPLLSHGALIINEVAWMGTWKDGVLSPNDEWIELRNTTDQAIGVSGWALSDGNTLTITLSGSVPGNGLVLLERTDDSTVPGVSAFLVYTGALSNDGRTLTLRNSSGGIEDEVVGGAGWENIGGDTKTEGTPQRTDHEWITARPTPGTSTSGSVSPKQTSTSEKKEETNTGSGVRVSLVPSDPDTLAIEVRKPEAVYVNQPVNFTAEPSGLGKTVRNSLVYTWNFGDTNTAEGRSVTHTFHRPGTYALVLVGSYGKYSARSVEKITVLPVALSLTTNSDGVMIKNTASHDTDVSRHVIVGRERFTLPKDTLIFSGESILIEWDHIGGATSEPIELHDVSGDVVASLEEDVTESISVPIRDARVFAPVPSETVRTVSMEAEDEAVTTSAPTAPSTATPVIIPIGSTQAAATGMFSGMMETIIPYISLLILIVGAGLFAVWKLRLPAVDK